MKKDELRPIKIAITDHQIGSLKNATGCFHRYITSKDEFGEATVALIELEDGKMIEIHPTWIMFTDR